MMHFWENGGHEHAEGFYGGWMMTHWLLPVLFILAIGLLIGFLIGKTQ